MAERLRRVDRTSFRHFQDELEQLKARLLEMGGLAEDRVRSAVRGAGRARSRRSSKRCSVSDAAINQLHIEIDDRCFKLLALHQPMAVDLRAIVSAVKINTDLERVGDLAVNIAEAVSPLPAAPARQGADRHPADGRDRAGHAARRARRLRPPRHSRSPSRCSTATTSSTRSRRWSSASCSTTCCATSRHDRAVARSAS